MRIEYKKDITVDQIPSNVESLVFKFNVNYVQSDSNAVVRPQATYLYTSNIDALTLNIGSSVPEGEGTYDTPDASWPFYLKHKIINSIVTESYDEFVISNETANQYHMMVGLYSLRGGVNESSLTLKPIFETNKEIMKYVFNYDNYSYRCSESTNEFYCGINYLSVRVNNNGYIDINNGSSAGCTIGSDGSSYCYPSFHY